MINGKYYRAFLLALSQMLRMKRYLLICFLSMVFAGTKAQQNYFIYLQSENKQLFTVKVNNKEYAASAAGYIIVPKLQMGNYAMEIKFPKDEWPRQTVNITVNGDAGYVLKNFGEKGWGLFNLQSMAIVMNDAGQTKADNPATPAMPQPKETSIAQPIIKVAEATPAPEKITQYMQAMDAEGYSAVYIILGNAVNDTVRLLIPGGQIVPKEEKVKPMEEQPKLEASMVKPEEKKQEVSALKPTAVAENKNSVCPADATEKDFFKLRKKMAEENNTESMLKEAEKGFKNKCFTTEQVKNLSVLFLSDEGRLQFLKVAYAHVSDKQNISALSSIFVDKTYAEKLSSLSQ